MGAKSGRYGEIRLGRVIEPLHLSHETFTDTRRQWFPVYG